MCECVSVCVCTLGYVPACVYVCLWAFVYVCVPLTVSHICLHVPACVFIFISRSYLDSRWKQGPEPISSAQMTSTGPPRSTEWRRRHMAALVTAQHSTGAGSFCPWFQIQTSHCCCDLECETNVFRPMRMHEWMFNKIEKVSKMLIVANLCRLFYLVVTFWRFWTSELSLSLFKCGEYDLFMNVWMALKRY